MYARKSTLCAAVATLAAGLAVSGPLAIAQPAAAPDAAQVYQAHCAACHGAALEGDSGPPLISQNMAGFNAADLTARIQQTMPRDAPGSLSDAEYRALAALILTRNGVQN